MEYKRKLFNSLLSRKKDFEMFLTLSICNNRELSGAYIYEDNKMCIFDNIKLGKKNSVSNVNLNKINHLSSVILFHTHLSPNNPPSGNDIISLIFTMFNKRKHIYGCVIELKNVYLYWINVNIIKNIFQLQDKKSLNQWKNLFIKNINKLAEEFYHDNDKKKYINKMSKLGVHILIQSI